MAQVDRGFRQFHCVLAVMVQEVSERNIKREQVPICKLLTAEFQRNRWLSNWTKCFRGHLWPYLKTRKSIVYRLHILHEDIDCVCLSVVACRLRASNGCIWGGRHRCANGMAGSGRLLADRWRGRRGVLEGGTGATVGWRGGSWRRGGEAGPMLAGGPAKSGDWDCLSFPCRLHELSLVKSH